MCIDLSQNQLVSLGNIQSDTSCTIKNLNLSHNSLQNVSLDSHFQMAEIQELDLSHNHIDTTLGIIYPLPHLSYINLSYNHIYTIPDLVYMAPNLTYIDLSHNLIHIVPDLVYTGQYLTYIDLSYNAITESPFIYTDKMSNKSHLDNHKVANLNYNKISHIWLNAFWDSRLPVYKILQNYHILLEGNPLNCDCGNYRIYDYLISSSRSERPNLIQMIFQISVFMRLNGNVDILHNGLEYP